ncbi:energy transducer TonB [Formicincola oecophyllae]|uniref:energy transducer TonB n=1 Tax=Formicincola oecophyllae TaxID=2558361 RepID=UPI001F0ECFD0|nr:energy transducer TonB [Formicincola oecophyllae]
MKDPFFSLTPPQTRPEGAGTNAAGISPMRRRPLGAYEQALAGDTFGRESETRHSLLRPEDDFPGLMLPWCLSLGVQLGALVVMLLQQPTIHGTPKGVDQPQVEMVFDTPPVRHSETGPRVDGQEDAGSPPPAATAPAGRRSPVREEAPTVPEDRAGKVATRRAAPKHRRQSKADERVRRAFAHPQEYTFNTPTQSPGRRPGRRRRWGGGPIDMSLGPLSLNGAINAPYRSSSRVKGVTSDYGAEIDRWIRAHMFYPEDAAENGEEGPVSVHVVIDRTGRVSSVRLVDGSGAHALDDATTGMFNGAKLPPVPDTMAGNHFDLDVTINYILVRN